MPQNYTVSKDFKSVFHSGFINVINSPGAKIDYSIESGSEFRAIGSQGKGYCSTTQGLLATSYSLSYLNLKIDAIQNWHYIINDLGGNLTCFPFNDPSDNFVFEFDQEGVKQYGVFAQSCVNSNKYRAYKVYEAGNKRAFYPIYYYPPSSSIQINGQDLSDTTVTLDFETGVFTSTSFNLTNSKFETDLYYKLVKLDSAIMYDHKRGAGTFGAGLINSEIDLLDNIQRFDMSVKLKEVFLSEKFSTPCTETVINNPLLQKLLLNNHQNDLSSGLMFNNISESVDEKQFTKALDGGNQGITKLTIPGRELSLTPLTYWKTLYLATSGGDLSIEEIL
jgi:hypothetical protein